MAFQYILDNTVILTNEPLGWDQSKLKIARNDVLKGIFIQYITSLTFVGDGYDYILAKSISDGICSIVEIEITDTSNTDAFSFSGKIYIENVKFNLTKCSVECVVEDDSLAGSVIRLLKNKVECYNTDVSIGGEAITPVVDSIDMGYSTTAFWNDVTGYIGNVGVHTGFKIFDLIQYLLNYITDNSVTLVSTLLSTDFLTEKKTYTLGGTVAVSDVISYSYVNVWGVTVSGTVTSSSTSLTTLGREISLAMSMQCNTNGGTPTFEDVTAAYNGDTLMYISNASAYATYSNILYIHHFAPFTVSFSSTGATTFTEAQVQAYQYGAGDLYITNGAIMNNNKLIMNISLEEILEKLFMWFNISTRFYKSGGVQYCRIEQAKYFFDQVNNINIDAFNDLSQEYVTNIGLSTLNYSQPEYSRSYYGIFNEASYSTKNCYVRTQDSDSDWHIGYAHIYYRLDLTDNDIVVFQSNGIKMNADYFTVFNISNYPPNFAFTQDGLLAATSFALLHYYVAKNHGYFGAPELVFNGRNLVIDDTIQIQKVYEFSSWIDCTTYNSIIDNPIAKISFVDASGNIISGWIKEAEYNITNSLLKLALYSE